MKVIVDSNIEITGVFKPPKVVELLGPEASLRELLQELSRLCRTIEFINTAATDIGSDIDEIFVNGRECPLSEHLDTALREGDKVLVRVLVAPLGGG